MNPDDLQACWRCGAVTRSSEADAHNDWHSEWNDTLRELANNTRLGMENLVRRQDQLGEKVRDALRRVVARL